MCRLKADIKLKAFQSGNELQYYFQNKDMQNELNKIEVTQNTVQTPRDIFNAIKNEEKLDSKFLFYSNSFSSFLSSNSNYRRGNFFSELL